MYLLFKVYSSLWLPTKVWMYVCTRHDIFTSCISKAYFEINRKPLQSGKYSGYISLFLVVKMKDKFPSQRPSCSKFSQQRTSNA